jgi:hypothetical protein
MFSRMGAASYHVIFALATRSVSIFGTALALGRVSPSFVPAFAGRARYPTPDQSKLYPH